MASGGPEEGEAVAREEQALRKLVVRLQNVQERKRLETLVQTLSDLLELAARQSAPRLFSGKNVHVPLLLVVDLYPGAAGVQQVTFSMHWRAVVKILKSKDSRENMHPAKLEDILVLHATQFCFTIN